MRIIGINPGRLGGIAVIDEKRSIELLEEIPNDGAVLMNMLEEIITEDSVVYVEDMNAKNTDKTMDRFKLGWEYGQVKTCLDILEVDYNTIAISAWQAKLMRYEGWGEKEQKTKLIEKLKKLWPDHRFNNSSKNYPKIGIVEALLIAEYARQKAEAA